MAKPPRIALNFMVALLKRLKSEVGVLENGEC